MIIILTSLWPLSSIYLNILASAANGWATYLRDINEVVHASQEQRAGQGEVLAHFATTSPDQNSMHPFTAATYNWLAGGLFYPPGGVIGDGSEPWNHWGKSVLMVFLGLVLT